MHRDDFRFAETAGNHVNFGRAGDCYSSVPASCRKGRFSIDLRGTGLRVPDNTEWETWGSPKVPQRMMFFKKVNDGQIVYAECGGSCGGCQPKMERLYLEPQNCVGELSAAFPHYEINMREGNT